DTSMIYTHSLHDALPILENLQVRLTYESSDILTIEAARFLEKLHKKFESERRRLLAFRREQQKRFDAGEKPNFRKETKAIRDGRSEEHTSELQSRENLVC